jgi:hypothetical protein
MIGPMNPNAMLTLARPSARPCPKCGRHQTGDGHDPCIANLPGVRAACCGHGVQPGYVAFENGTVIRGVFEIENLDADGLARLIAATASR